MYIQNYLEVIKNVYSTCIIYYTSGDCNYAGTRELQVKELLEKFFIMELEKIRPKWLVNITGYPMELDMYNEKTKIGIEYQGIQHYQETPFFHRTPTSFQEQLDKDKLKRILCKENGIFLIEIPYYEKNIIKLVCNIISSYFK